MAGIALDEQGFCESNAMRHLTILAKSGSPPWKSITSEAIGTAHVVHSTTV